MYLVNSVENTGL